MHVVGNIEFYLKMKDSLYTTTEYEGDTNLEIKILKKLNQSGNFHTFFFFFTVRKSDYLV